jgi:heptosyltransferase-2
VRSLVLVGPGEETIGDAVVAGARHRPIFDRSRILGLDVLKPIVRDLALLVTTDTGTRHYAVAFDVPLVVIMGPTDPRYTAAYLERSEVARHELACGPCHLKHCPLDHECMRGVSPAEVLSHIEELERRLGPFLRAR